MKYHRIQGFMLSESAGCGLVWSSGWQRRPKLQLQWQDPGKAAAGPTQL